MCVCARARSLGHTTATFIYYGQKSLRHCRLARKRFPNDEGAIYTRGCQTTDELNEGCVVGRGTRNRHQRGTWSGTTMWNLVVEVTYSMLVIEKRAHSPDHDDSENDLRCRHGGGETTAQARILEACQQMVASKCLRRRKWRWVALSFLFMPSHATLAHSHIVPSLMHIISNQSRIYTYKMGISRLR